MLGAPKLQHCLPYGSCFDPEWSTIVARSAGRAQPSAFIALHKTHLCYTAPPRAVFYGVLLQRRLKLDKQHRNSPENKTGGTGSFFPLALKPA